MAGGWQKQMGTADTQNRAYPLKDTPCTIVKHVQSPQVTEKNCHKLPNKYATNYRKNPPQITEYHTIIAPTTTFHSVHFCSLFKDSDYYMRIVDAISKKNIGLTRTDIVKEAKTSNNGTLTKALKNLITCDFIRKYNGFKKKERDSIYQLTDLSILFYKRFVERYYGKDTHHWTNTIDSPARRAWTGIAFEQVCLLHVPQIKQALGIAGVQTEVSSWRYAGNEYTDGVQIDMLIVRRDKTINLCELKYSAYEYDITAKYSKELRARKEIFRSITQTRHSISTTMITPWGIRNNANSYVADSSVTLEQLFQLNR